MIGTLCANNFYSKLQYSVSNEKGGDMNYVSKQGPRATVVVVDLLPFVRQAVFGVKTVKFCVNSTKVYPI
jgi:hypothetical protein